MKVLITPKILVWLEIQEFQTSLMLRPRVVDYSVSEGANSPFEFSGRSFADGQEGRTHSSSHIIASDESMTLDYNYFLGRVDRIFIDTTGKAWCSSRCGRR